MPTNVLIAGGGPAALEAALRLHRLAGDRVAVTVLAPRADFTYRPLTVLEPFAAGSAWSYPLSRFAADARFTHREDALARVDMLGHAVETASGERIPYDVLLVACGARPVRPYERATMFTGAPSDADAVHGLVQDVEGGYVRSVAFVVPPGVGWPLPLYELALMLAERAFEMGVDVELHLVTPEARPLGLFGADAASEVAGLLHAAKIVLHAATRVEDVQADGLRLARGGERLAAGRVVTLPRLEGPGVPGLPSDAHGFLVTDAFCRVPGASDVYAAGDVTAFPVKQGGLACQQADAAAGLIAARAGAPVEPEPFRPVLRGMLLTERWARFLRRDGEDERSDVAGRALWWPPTKIAGRELAGYLETLDEELGHVRGRPVETRLDAGTRAVEVLSLH